MARPVGRAQVRDILGLMGREVNFGDPSYEPTDAELTELMREAFADVPARNAAALKRVHDNIAKLREEGLAWLELQSAPK